MEITEFFAASNEPCTWNDDNMDASDSDYCVFYEFDSLDLNCVEGVDCSKAPSTFISFTHAFWIPGSKIGFLIL